MVEYKVGLTPGVIVGGVLVLLVLTAMLASTIIVVWRSRPSAQRRKALTLAVDLERAQRKSRGAAVEKDKGGDTPTPTYKGAEEDMSMSFDSPSLSDGDPQSPITPPAPVHYSQSVPSTLNVIISPSVPHLVKLGANGALEVRVTPPSPVLVPGGASMRFRGGLPGGTPGENDSVWWVI